MIIIEVIAHPTLFLAMLPEKVDASDERRDPAAAEKNVEAPQPRRGVKHRPQPKHGREATRHARAEREDGWRPACVATKGSAVAPFFTA